MDYIERNYKALIEFIYFTKDRFENICIPLKSNASFDLVAFSSSDSRTLNRIKIICSETKKDSGSYQANLLVSGGYAERKEVKKPFNPSSCDFVFVWTPEHKYLIPTSIITQKKAIVLSKFEEFRIKIPG